MEALYVIIGIIIYVLGLATGLYAASQVERHVYKRTKNK
jgi:hypothetical protein